MPKPTAILTNYVMERISEEPLPKRIQLTRALASLTVNPAKRAALTKMADQLAAIDRQHAQLLLDLKHDAE